VAPLPIADDQRPIASLSFDDGVRVSHPVGRDLA